MLFYSFEFIYLFFPIAIAGYFWAGKRNKRLAVIWLVICSIFFYGWWNPPYVLFLVGSILFNYFYGLMLRTQRNRLMFGIGIAFNLGLIAYYKYAGFFCDITNNITGQSFDLGSIVLPLGISFFTFQQIAWLVDSHSGKISDQDKGLWEYGLFVSFFPQLIAGPIVHHSEMMAQFHEKKNRFLNWENMAIGVTIFVIGLSKKVIIADAIAPYANMVFNAAMADVQIGFLDAWVGSLAYTMQLYFDFSGYADMAIGLALMFNIRLPINFDSPYKSISIADFWRRWHITLSRFLRDYVYIPLGGSRVGEQRRYVNLMLTMLIGGLWHGAGWTFVFWGGLHGLFLVIHRLWNTFNVFRMPKVAAQALTFLCIVSAWVFFRAETFDSACRILTAMATLKYLSGELLTVNEFTGSLKYLVPSLFIVFFLPNTQDFIGDLRGGLHVYQNPSRGWNFFNPRFQTNFLWLGSIVALSVTSVYFILDQSNIHEFIYFQF